MANALATDQALKVHCAGDGAIWWADGNRGAFRSHLGVHDFPDGDEARKARTVRLLGTRENAPLITRFYAAKARGQLASVAVASPLVGMTQAERADPALMLQRMGSFQRPPSLGGWHEVTALDHVAYLLATFFTCAPATPGRVAGALQDYPVLRYTGFIPHLDLVKLSELISVILDPRWFSHQGTSGDEHDPQSIRYCDQDQSRSLRQYLGLDPRHAGLGAPDGIQAARARLVRETWKTTASPPDGALRDEPGYFLWRRWRKYNSAEQADLRTGQLFVEYLRQCWLDAIYMTRVKPDSPYRPDGLFADDHFFSDSATVAAFRRHMGRSPYA